MLTKVWYRLINLVGSNYTGALNLITNTQIQIQIQIQKCGRAQSTWLGPIMSVCIPDLQFVDYMIGTLKRF